MIKEINTMTGSNVAEQSRTFYYLRWNKSSIKEIKQRSATLAKSTLAWKQLIN